jgi:tricorn protease
MKRLFSFIIVLALLPGVVLAAQEARFMTWPDINADRIVFTYDGDLWICPAEGGQAIRLTAHRGNEIASKFSPDGK